MQRPRRVYENRRTTTDVLVLARRLGPEMGNATLADALNAAGHRTATGRAFDANAVSSLRRYHKLAAPDLLDAGELTAGDVASRLGVTTSTVTSWVARGLFPARKGLYNRWCIPFPPELEDTWRSYLAGCTQVHNDIDPRHGPKRTYYRPGGPVAGGKTGGRVPLGRLRPPTDWTGPAGRKYVHFTSEIETACRQRIFRSAHLPTPTKTEALPDITGDAV